MPWSPTRLVATCAVACAFARPALAQAPNDVPAQGAPDDSEQAPKDEAKRRFLRGLEFARADQNWDAALAEFLASRELFPTQVALLNAAISLTKLGRYDEALQMYAELHERFDASMTAEERAVVDAEVADLKNRVGEIEIALTEPGVTVEIDGRARETTPLARPLSVAPGTHSVRLTKVGFQTYESRVVVASGQQRRLEVQLERIPEPGLAARPLDPSAERPQRATPTESNSASPHFFFSAAAGVFLTSTLGGDAAASCGSPPRHEGQTLPDCRDQDSSLGPLLSAALGYEVVSGLELELSFGYLRTRERLVRSVIASGDLGQKFVSTDHVDETELSAMLAMLGLGHRFEWPVLVDARLKLGVARANLQHKNSGTFSITAVNPDDSRDIYSGSKHVSVPELDSSAWLPLIAPELRFGLQVSKRFGVDLGVSLLLLVGPADLRTGATSISDTGERRTALTEVPGGFRSERPVQPGVLALPEERGLGTIVAFAPTLGLRVEL